MTMRKDPGKTYSSEEQKQIDEDSIPLTADSQAKLDRDTFNYDKQKEIGKAEHKILKGHDDSCAAFMMEHIGPEMFQEMIISPLFATWRGLPIECKDRAVLLMRMLKDLFSSGNASDAVEAMSNLFSIKQSSEQLSPSAFINSLTEAFEATIPLIEDKNNRGMINAQQLKTILLIHGLGKFSSANKEGIKNHLRDNPVDALVKANDLIAAVLKAHMSDANEERASSASESSAAFAASIAPSKFSAKKTTARAWEYRKDNPDYSEIPGADHCNNFHTLTKLFFYGHNPAKCNRTAESEKARKAKKDAKLHAKAAVVDTPAPASAKLSEEERMEEMFRAYMVKLGFSMEAEA